MQIRAPGWKFLQLSKEGINIENLAEVAGEDYSDTSWMPTCDWMVSALGH